MKGNTMSTVYGECAEATATPEQAATIRAISATGQCVRVEQDESRSMHVYVGVLGHEVIRHWVDADGKISLTETDAGDTGDWVQQ